MIKKIIGTIVILFIVIMVVVLILIFWRAKPAVVLLINGDIYVGLLKEYFGKVILKEPWLLQTQFNPQNNQTQRVLVRWSTTLWEPKDFLIFNKNQVIFWSYLKKDGSFWQSIEKNKNLGTLYLQAVSPQTPQSTQPQP